MLTGRVVKLFGYFVFMLIPIYTDNIKKRPPDSQYQSQNDTDNNFFHFSQPLIKKYKIAVVLRANNLYFYNNLRLL